MSVPQQVWRRLRPYADAAASRVTTRRGRFAGATPTVQLEEYQRASRYVTVEPSVRPFEAGGYHLRIVLAAATEAGVPTAAIPLGNGIAYRLMVRQPDAAGLWQALVRTSVGTATYATWNGDWGPATRLLSDCDPARLAAADEVLVHRYLRTDYNGLASPYQMGCSVEHWVPAANVHPADGTAWRSRKPNPRHTVVLWSSEQETTVDVPGVGPVATLRVFLDDAVLTPRFPVDAVYLWVDDSDPTWRQRRDDTLRALGRAPVGGTDVARFRHHGELRYAMRSLEYFAPWIRRVFLLTDGQRPDWLVADDSVVTVVDHREIWDDPAALPVFNSHAITARMHHIPGLADQYLYINDDVFFGSPVLPRQWFTPSGQPIFQNTSSTLPDRALLAALPSHDNARYNSLRLVEQASGLRPTRLFMHGPIAQSRPWQLELEARFPEDYDRTARSRFRARTDLEPIWLHHYLGYVEGRTVPGNLRYEYFSLADPTAAQRLAELSRMRRAQVFCINDDGTAPAANIEAIRTFLPSFFPIPSRFEAPGS